MYFLSPNPGGFNIRHIYTGTGIEWNLANRRPTTIRVFRYSTIYFQLQWYTTATLNSKPENFVRVPILLPAASSIHQQTFLLFNSYFDLVDPFNCARNVYARNRICVYIFVRSELQHHSVSPPHPFDHFIRFSQWVFQYFSSLFFSRCSTPNADALLFCAPRPPILLNNVMVFIMIFSILDRWKGARERETTSLCTRIQSFRCCLYLLFRYVTTFSLLLFASFAVFFFAFILSFPFFNSCIAVKCGYLCRTKLAE